MMHDVTIVLPVYNEENKLRKNTLKVLDFCKKNLKQKFIIVIADNNSTDNTRKIAEELSKEHKEIEYLYIDIKGKGAACKLAWTKYKSKVNLYMDVDLATDLRALPRLIDEIFKGYDIVVGSRYLKGSNVRRTFLRIILSKGYLFIVHHYMHTKISDFQCGFKAVNEKVVDKLLPVVKDNQFFFDTEILIKAERKGFKIKEIPIKWREGTETKTKLIGDSLLFLKQLRRLKKELKRERNRKRLS